MKAWVVLSVLSIINGVSMAQAQTNTQQTPPSTKTKSDVSASDNDLQSQLQKELSLQALQTLTKENGLELVSVKFPKTPDTPPAPTTTQQGNLSNPTPQA